MCVQQSQDVKSRNHCRLQLVSSPLQPWSTGSPESRLGNAVSPSLDTQTAGSGSKG